MPRSTWGAADSEVAQRPQRRPAHTPSRSKRSAERRASMVSRRRRPLQPVVQEGTATRAMHRRAWWRTAVALLLALGFVVWPRTPDEVKALSEVQSASELALMGLARITSTIVHIAEVVVPEERGAMQVTVPTEIIPDHPPVITSPLPIGSPSARRVVLVEESRQLQASAAGATEGAPPGPVRPYVVALVQKTPEGYAPGATLDKLSKKLEVCYADRLVYQPALEGRATAVFTLGKRGAKERVRLLDNTLEDVELTACVRGALDGMKLKGAPKKGTVQLALRFAPRT